MIVKAKIPLFFLLAMVFYCSVGAGAVSNPAIEGLETLRRGFVDVSDFTADITQEKQLSLMKRKIVSQGVVRFKKPGIFYMELFPPNASRLLMKDNLLTIRLPKQGVTDRIPLPPEEGLEKWFAFLSRPVTALPEGVDVRAERAGGIWTLHILPGSKGSVKGLRVVFDLQGKIKSVAIDERNGDKTIIRFRNFRRNTGLKERDFRLE